MVNEFIIQKDLIVNGRGSFGDREAEFPSQIENDLEVVNLTGDVTLGIIASNADSSILNFGDSDDNEISQIKYNHLTKQMRFDIEGVTEITIDSVPAVTVTTVTNSMVVGNDLTVGGLATITETVIVGGGAAFGDITRLHSSIANEIEAVNDAGNASIGIFTGGASVGSYNFGTGITAASANIEYNHASKQMRLIIDGTPKLTIDAFNGTTTIATDVVITGDLTVNGTTTTVNSTNLNITDNVILLNKEEVGPGVTLGIAGIEIERGPITDNAGWFYNEAEDWWGPTGPNGILGVGGATQSIGNISVIDSTDSTDQVLTINAFGAIKIPVGTTVLRPVPPVAGMFRFNPDTTDELEYYNGTIWKKIVAGVNGAGDFVNVTGDTMTGDLTMDTGSQIFIDDGILANPSLAFSDDTDTGIYSPLNGAIGFVSNGTEHFRIGPTETNSFVDFDMNGNVLVDVKDPTDPSHVGDQGFNDARYLLEANNLSDLTNAATARINLGIVAGGAGDIWVEKAGDTMTGDLNMAADILPTTNLTRDLGSPALQFVTVFSNNFEGDTFGELDFAGGITCMHIPNGQNRIIFKTGGTTERFRIDNTQVVTSVNIMPSTNNTRNIGSSVLRFNTMFATTFNGTATAARYADLAERYAADGPTESGDVVVFGGEAEITLCTFIQDTAVAGIISTNPAYMMNSDAGPDMTHPYVALKGKVPCKVIGPIKKGDLIVTSDVKGHGRSIGRYARAYAAFARAVEDFDGGTGIIQVSVI